MSVWFELAVVAILLAIWTGTSAKGVASALIYAFGCLLILAIFVI
jgi:hypothetical protein